VTGASPDPDRLERRVILCAPTGRDARLIGHILNEAGIDFWICTAAGGLAEEVARGAGAVLIAEEALTEADQLLLAATLTAQPAWSDLSLILLTIRGEHTPSVGSAIRALGNVTLLERPLRAWALLSVVRTALRARGRQYEMRRHLEQLKDADRRKDEFLASLAHELRNPLAPIRNSVGLLRLSNIENPTVKMAADVIDRQSKQLSRLVDDLLDLSRITRGKVSLQRVEIALAEVLRNAVETSEPLLRNAGVTLDYTPPAPTILVDVDPVRIAQAVSNVLNNAAKFTPRDGRVTLTAKCEEGIAEIRIRDTGMGIAPHMLEGIFDLFVQGEPRDGMARGGLGIGLTLVRRFVEMHDGTVEASSDGPGRGTEFVMRLPCVIRDRPETPCATDDEEETRYLALPARPGLDRRLAPS